MFLRFFCHCRIHCSLLLTVSNRKILLFCLQHMGCCCASVKEGDSFSHLCLEMRNLLHVILMTWAKHPICGHRPTPPTALTVFLTLSVVRGIGALGRRSFHCFCHPFSQILAGVTNKEACLKNVAFHLAFIANVICHYSQIALCSPWRLGVCGQRNSSDNASDNAVSLWGFVFCTKQEFRSHWNYFVKESCNGAQSHAAYSLI